MTGCDGVGKSQGAHPRPRPTMWNPGGLWQHFYLETDFKPVHDIVHMTAMTYTAARENLASTMDRVCIDRDPVLITRKRDQAVVMLSLEDYESLQETAYLLRTPANATRLLDSIENLNAGKIVKKGIQDLMEP